MVAAASVGLTATGFCADAVLAAARGEHLAFGAVQDREALAVLQRRLFEATAEVNRIGVNLNQAVAAFNATGRTPVWLGRAVLTCEMTITKLDVLAVEIDRRLR